MKDLSDKVVLVTGASMGIGAGISEALARQGCHVALLARGRPALEQLADQIKALGGQTSVFACDATDMAAVTAVVEQIERQLGPVDILINNAGAGTFKPMDMMSAEEMMLAIDLPFRAALLACYAVIPAMKARGSGHIVNLTSPAGYFPLPNMVPYTAARHAMVGLSLSLREELAEHQIGVTLICPAKVNTDYFTRNDADFSWYPRLSSLFPVLEPARVGDEVVSAIKGNYREHIFPLSLKLTVRAFQHIPRLSILILRALRLWQPAR